MIKKDSFAGNANNQYNPEVILKESSDFFGQALRVIDSRSESGYYSHFRATYNVLSLPTKVSYYRGTKPYVTNVTCVPASTLNSKYFVLHTAPDNQLIVVWYNVNGSGTAPVVTGANFIEVPVTSSDVAEVVAAVTKVTLEHSGLFTANRIGPSVTIRTAGYGSINASFDVSTGFTITGTDGEQELVQEVNLLYQGTDPVYKGQVLKGYSFDIYSAKYVKNPELEVNNVSISDQDGSTLAINSDGSLNVNVVSTGQILKSYFYEKTNVLTGITEEIYNYTAVAPVFLQKVELSGTNIATFELYIDGIIQDRKLTFFNGNLENLFNFNQGLNIAAGQVISVRVYHNRPEAGSFTARMQILESGA